MYSVVYSEELVNIEMTLKISYPQVPNVVVMLLSNKRKD